MMTKSNRIGIALLACLHLAGCATDQQATQTEGTVIGGVLGAVVGGVLGGVAGKLAGANDQQMRTYIVAGASVGAVAGGYKGHEWGTAVARRKEEYARTEDYIGASISDAQNMRIAAQNENAHLRSVLAQMSARQAQIQAAYARGKINQRELMQQNQSIQREVADASQKLSRLNQEIATQEFARQQAGNDTSIGTVNSLDSEIIGLKQQRDEMVASVNSLSTMSGGGGMRGGGFIAQPSTPANQPTASSNVVRDANGTLYLKSAVQ